MADDDCVFCVLQWLMMGLGDKEGNGGGDDIRDGGY